MRRYLLTLSIAGSMILPGAARSPQDDERAAPVFTRIPVSGATLQARVIGQGQPVIVLHGGPDFDHSYLVPDLDRLKDVFRLIYYDQRGRGLSADGVEPDDVTLASDLDDIDRVRAHFGLEAPALMGHSWGAVLALEYALRHPSRVSRLILMNPAPVSISGLTTFRTFYLQKLGAADRDRQAAIAAGDAYQAGDPAAVAARYRIHFKHALRRTQDYEQLMAAMTAAFLRQRSEGILKARAIEERLMRDTWDVPGYDLLPKLHHLQVPTLVVTGDHDFVPVEVSRHIADALPRARLITFENCGHFTYLECPDGVRRALEASTQR